ncbi:hypothetical protein EDB84DRAFT_1562337 [Lactarius hengduanensis]|nr:hypothetical protein EDB84DRAFT_1562337 [Lactarius hengduanensis]
MLCPTPDAPSGPSPSPPTDMGRPDPAGRMTARGQAPRPLSPMEVVWGASTQTQAARTVLNELRDLSRQPLPTSAEISEVHAASIDEAAEWANIWADTIAPLREGYSRYTLREPIPLIKGGNRIEPAHALDTAFKVVVAALGAGFDKPGTPQDRTLASNHWFRGASAVLASTIRGMLSRALENPSNQLELLRSMTEQLLSELTVQGEDRLNREDLWNSIKEQEISMLRDAMGKAAERDAPSLIEDLEAEDSPHALGIALANPPSTVLLEADAQAFSREDYFNRELAAIYPEVHQEAHDAAKKEALQAAALFKERLTNQKCAAASKEHDGDLYRASIKATTLKKVTDSQKGAGKKARAIKVDARRTNLADVLDNLNYDSPEEGLITHDHLTALVESESNMNTDEPLTLPSNSERQWDS